MATPVTHWNTGEGLTVGQEVLASHTGGDSGMVFQFLDKAGGGSVSAVSPGAHGNCQYRMLAPAGAVATLVWSGFATRNIAQRMYIYLAAPPTVAQQIMLNRADTAVGRLFVNTDGKIGLQNARGTGTTNMMSGTPVYPLVLRLETLTKVDDRYLWGGWATGDGPIEGFAEMIDTDLGTLDITTAQYGKLSGTSWDADFRIDDVAANIQATAAIGPWAAEYTQPAGLVASQTDNVDPGKHIILTPTGGDASGVEQIGGVRVALIPTDEGWLTFEAPWTLDGTMLAFQHTVSADDSPATVMVDVLPSVAVIQSQYGLVPCEIQLGPVVSPPPPRFNLIHVSSFEGGVSPWYGSRGGVVSSTLDESHSGLSSMKVVTDGSEAAEGAAVGLAGVDPAGFGATVVLSAWVKAEVGVAFRLYANEYSLDPNTYHGQSIANFIGTGDWQLMHVRRSMTLGTKVQPAILTTSAVATTFYVDEVMLEIGYLPSKHFNGDTTDADGIRYSYLGAARASASLAIPGDLPIFRGTVYADGQPWPDVRVNMYPHDEVTFLAGTTSDINGQFVFPARQEGLYRLWVQPYETGFANQWVGGADATTATVFNLDADLDVRIDLVGSFPNQPPTAVFDYSANGLVLSVDGSGSSDPEAAIASYAWTFGDGATATGVTATRTYAAAGTYDVTLTVTDSNGVATSQTQSIAITADAFVGPSAATNLRVVSKTDTTIDWAWDAAAPGTYPIGNYRILKDNKYLGETPGLTYQFAGLTPGTAVEITVRPYDTQDNIGPDIKKTETTLAGAETHDVLTFVQSVPSKVSVKTWTSALLELSSSGPTTTPGHLLTAAVGLDKSSGGFGAAPAGWQYLGTPYVQPSVSQAVLVRIADGSATDRSCNITWTTAQGWSGVITEWAVTGVTLAEMVVAVQPSPADDLARAELTATAGAATEKGFALAFMSTDSGGSAYSPTWSNGYTQRDGSSGDSGNGFASMAIAGRALITGDDTAVTGNPGISDQHTLRVVRFAGLASAASEPPIVTDPLYADRSYYPTGTGKWAHLPPLVDPVNFEFVHPNDGGWPIREWTQSTTRTQTLDPYDCVRWVFPAEIKNKSQGLNPRGGNWLWHGAQLHNDIYMGPSGQTWHGSEADADANANGFAPRPGKTYWPELGRADPGDKNRMVYMQPGLVDTTMPMFRGFEDLHLKGDWGNEGIDHASNGGNVESGLEVSFQRVRHDKVSVNFGLNSDGVSYRQKTGGDFFQIWARIFKLWMRDVTAHTHMQGIFLTSDVKNIDWERVNMRSAHTDINPATGQPYHEREHAEYMFWLPGSLESNRMENVWATNDQKSRSSTITNSGTGGTGEKINFGSLGEDFVPAGAPIGLLAPNRYV